MSSRRTLAIIPARAGSKRLPGKNIRILGNKPLIAWTIEAALKSGCFTDVVVSTDDPKIAEVAVMYNATVPFMRPDKLSSDTATSDSVIEHAVTWLEAKERIKFDMVTLLQPTSPFRNAKHIQECFSQFEFLNASAVVSVCPVDIKLEICNQLPANKSLKGFLNTQVSRTQDMNELYKLNGAIYMFRREIVGRLSSVYDSQANSFAYVMEATESVDIDTVLDFEWAEFLLSKICN